MTKTQTEATAPTCPAGGCRDARAAYPGICAPFFSRLVLLAASVATFSVFALSPASASAATTLAGPGSGAGQVSAPISIAVGQADGILYVGDNNNFRIDEFNLGKPPAEAFLRAFGWGVRDGAQELQTCTAVTGCGVGSGNTGGGPPGKSVPGPVAVDPSTHNLYVSAKGLFRVEEFTPSGEFVLMFGQEVDRTTHGNVCTAASHDTCGAGVASTDPGAFGPGGPNNLAFDPAGNLWVGDVNRLEEFSAAGVFLSEVALPGEGKIAGLGIDAAGNFYTLSEPGAGGISKVRKYDHSGSPLDFTSLGTNVLDEGGQPHAIALDGAGHIYVSDQAASGSYRFLEFDAATGAQVEVFGAGEVIGHPGGVGEGGAIALGADGNLYSVSSASDTNSAVQSFAIPPAGPLVRGLSGSSIHGTGGTGATLVASLNAEGAETHYRFQYLTQQQFEADGGQFGVGTQESPEEVLPAGFSEPEVSASISGLTGGTDYHFRLLAENAHGKGNTEETQASFTTDPPLRIDSVYSSTVTSSSAILNAQINPLGVSSEYYFEYLTEAAYRENIDAGREPFAGAVVVPSPSGVIPASEADVSVSQDLRSLSPRTSYVYSVVAHNSGGSAVAGALSFVTQALGALSLPDGRGWELVSPAEKHGALFKPIAEAGVVDASADGGAISYLASNPTEADPQGYTNQAQVLSARSASGWQSNDLSLPNLAATGLSVGVGQEYRFFSEDLAHAIVEPFFPADLAAISSEATEITPFLRTNFTTGSPTASCGSGCYRPILTSAEGIADVPPGTKFAMEAPGVPCTGGLCGVHFRAASPSAEHILLESQVGLTEIPGDEGGFYEWSAASPPTESVQLVSVLPNGKPAKRVGTGFNFQIAVERNAVSDDGSRVVWGARESHLYLRDLPRGETVQLDANQGGTGGGNVNAVFQGASSDGSRIFFTDEQALVPNAGAEADSPDLYECRIEAGEGALRCALTDLTPKSGGESADVQGLALGFSDDGSSIYFVADGVLAANVGADGSDASPGQCVGSDYPPHATCNLYVSRNGVLSFVATLSGSDFPSWGKNQKGAVGGLPGLTSRVSPNGEWLAFMSQRSLTGYDSNDASTGEPDQEVFLYHAGDAALICASCNPTGARPRGVEFTQIDASLGHLAGGDRVWPPAARLAASIPGWTPYASGLAVHQGRYLSNGGRLFFNSSDALAPKDSNSAEDVYEYEPPAGEGSASSDDCSAASTTFSAAAEGCIDLISSGTSGEESAFLDASESGDDVFFLTAARLAPRDEDGAVDVYDARVGGGEPQPAQAVQCEGDGCQQPPTPPVDATPGSLTFEGPGNVVEKPSKKKQKKGKHGKHRKSKKRKNADKKRGKGTSRKAGNK